MGTGRARAGNVFGLVASDAFAVRNDDVVSEYRLTVFAQKLDEGSGTIGAA
jgi:hypothetical protein